MSKFTKNTALRKPPQGHLNPVIHFGGIPAWIFMILRNLYLLEVRTGYISRRSEFLISAS